ncbi:restriction endonuclease subunit S [Pseudalkalibacillus hwajinpoensis]|uniref:restriction endonuclease subunit S n=1 Tax=Guptibacillus hwajinpoensis TaxID=208199 RepID=UPI001CFCBBAD|nr:restriction endonuclease subunit S [Pseudalkalibacillus hwajinpoensis]
MNAKDLKNSILQLAIQGKLLQQREEEGTAEELYQQIQEEKVKLIKDGKIKKPKKLPKIPEDEIPFDIPESWKWVRLGDLCEKIGSGSTPRGGKSVYKENGIKFLRSQNIYNDGLRVDGVAYISEEHNKQGSIVRPRDILLNITGGSIGRCALVPDDFDIANINQHVMIIRNLISENRFMLHYTLISPYIQSMIMSVQVGVSREGLSAEKLKKFLIPLPPLEEQKRIVAKIEEIMPYVEKYDEAFSEVEELNKKFPEDMQSSILKYAIQGKLVEQLEEEGTAEELYRQIQEEKKKLIKEGKIKKTKVLPKITEEELPCDIPENWKWVRLGDIIHLTSGQDMTSSKYNDISNGIPYLTGASNIQGGEIIINRWTPEPKAIALKGDILLTCKGTVGKTVILGKEEVHIARQIMSIRTIETDAEFIQYFIKSYVNILKAKAKSMIPGIERKDVLEALIPLPPLEEQKRIVEKIKELLLYTKQLVK